MSDFTIDFFGWCNEAGHDKVWGWVTVGREDPRLYNFWGRRGKKLSFKLYQGAWGQDELFWRSEEKTRPRSSGTYKKIPTAEIEIVCPGFIEDMGNQLVLAKLFGTVRGEG